MKTEQLVLVIALIVVVSLLVFGKALLPAKVTPVTYVAAGTQAAINPSSQAIVDAQTLAGANQQAYFQTVQQQNELNAQLTGQSNVLNAGTNALNALANGFLN